jgi:hypothetical protein
MYYTLSSTVVVFSLKLILLSIYIFMAYYKVLQLSELLTVSLNKPQLNKHDLLLYAFIQYILLCNV